MRRLLGELRDSPIVRALTGDRRRCLLAVDISGEIVEATLSARTVLGIRREELVGTQMSDWPLLVGESPVGLGLLSRLQRPAGPRRPGSAVECDGIATDPEGHRRGLHVRAVVVHTADGTDELGTLIEFEDIDLQVRSREVLREQQRLLHTVFQHTHQVIALLSPEGEILDINEHIDALGVRRDALLGRNVIDTLAAFDAALAQRWCARISAAAASNSPASQRFFEVLAPADIPALSSARAMDVWLTPIPGDDSGPPLIFLEISDQTEQYRAELRLRASEERFRAIAETLPQMVWTAAPDGRIEYFGPRWVDFTGRTLDELHGDGWLELVHPDDRALASRAPVAQGSGTDVRVFRLRDRHGEHRWMESQASGLLREDGAIERWFGAMLDITDRRIAEDHERAQAEHLEAAAELAGLGTFVWDLTSDTEAPTIDARYRRIHGLAPDEPLEQGATRWWLRHLHAADRERVAAAVRAAMVPGGPIFNQEYRFVRNDGATREERWLACAARVEFLPDGRPHRMVGTVQDVTLARRQDEMRVRVQKVEAIGTLVSAIAHDFNNVIGALRTYAHLAEAEMERGESPAESIHELARGTDRAADILRRVMAFAREDVPRSQPVDLQALVEEAVQLVRPTLHADTRLRISIAAGLPPLLADPTQLHQVLINLVTNAGQAMGSSGGVIEVDVREEEVEQGTHDAPGLDAGRYARIQVRDSGPGFPAAVAHRLFDPFFTTKPTGQGTGLGLASVQSIVAAHGGTVSAVSPTGGGAVFTVHLPLSTRRGDEASGGRAPTAQSRSAAPPTPQLLRVLFVDDEPALARLAERALPRSGCSVRAYSDPAEAIVAAEHDPDGFDVLITDLTMPEIGGLALIARLRVLRPELPVVLTSGYLSPRDERAARELGVDAILPKPCSMQALAAAASEICGR